MSVTTKKRQAITDAAISSGLTWLLLGVGAILVVLLAVMGLTSVQRRSLDAHVNDRTVTEQSTLVGEGSTADADSK